MPQTVTVSVGDLLLKSNCSRPVNSFCVTISFYFIWKTNNTSFAKLSAAVAAAFSPLAFTIHFHLPYSIFCRTLCFYPLPMLFMTRALSHRQTLKRSAHSLFALSWTTDRDSWWEGWGGVQWGWQRMGLEIALQNCQTFCA